MTFPARARIAAVAVAATLVVTGCSYTNPITTQVDYPASDGVQVRMGEVFAHNLLILAEEQGGFAVLTGSLSNDSRDDVTVTVTLDGEDATQVEVAARSTVIFGPGPNQTLITGTANVIPGLLKNVEFQANSQGSEVRQVQVIDGTLEQYRVVLEAAQNPENA